MAAFPAWSNRQISAKSKQKKEVALIHITLGTWPRVGQWLGSALPGPASWLPLVCLCVGLLLQRASRSSWLACAFFLLPSLLCCLLPGPELLRCLLFLQLFKWTEVVEPTMKLRQLWSLGSYNLDMARKSLSSSFADGASPQIHTNPR